jgi:hypothetical protein
MGMASDPDRKIGKLDSLPPIMIISHPKNRNEEGEL